MAAPTYLIDTSMVPAAIGASTSDHSQEYQKAVSNGKPTITAYIRMEVIRRIVCDFIHMAQMADQCRSVADFWFYQSQAFQQRKVKTAVMAHGLAGSSLGQASTPRELAEELATQAVSILRLVDRKLPFSSNNTRCQIGGKNLVVDFNNLLQDTGKFLIDFNENVMDCEVNSYLRLDNLRSSGNILIADVDAVKTGVVEELREIRDSMTWITCDHCKKIGDAVIAIEQPKRSTLIHGDKNTFPILCPLLGKREFYVESVQSIQHKKTGFHFKLSGKLPSTMPSAPSEQQGE